MRDPVLGPMLERYIRRRVSGEEEPVEFECTGDDQDP